jgi:hypothetical protein
MAKRRLTETTPKPTIKIPKPFSPAPTTTVTTAPTTFSTDKAPTLSKKAKQRMAAKEAKKRKVFSLFTH